MFWNVVWRSCETYAGLPFVVKYELTSEPGFAFAARAIAARTAWSFVTSPSEWKTTTVGGRTPPPKTLSVRWLVSYADLPGIEKLWYQRFETWPAANAPKNVRTIQTPMTNQRRRMTK